MPRVPTDQRRVSTAPFDPGRERLDTTVFGGGIGEGVEALGAGLLDATNDFQRLQKQEADREAKRLDLEFSQRVRVLGYGDGTPDNPGFYATRGQTALDQSVDFRDNVAKIREETLGKASSPDVREQVFLSTGRRVESESISITKHSLKEQEQADQDASNAKLQDTQDGAALAYNDSDKIALELVTARNEVLQQAQKSGLPPETGILLADRATGDVVRAAVLAALKAGDVARAEEVFEEFKAAVPGRTATVIKGDLKKYGDIIKGQTLAEQALSQFPDDEVGALRWLGTKAKGEVLERARLNARQGFAAQKRADKQRIQDSLSDFSTFLESGRGMFDDYAYANPAAHALLEADPSAMKTIRAAQEAFIEGRTFAIASDGQTKFDFMAQSPSQMARVPKSEVESLRPLLTEEEWNTVITAYKGALASQETDSKDSRYYRDGDRTLRQFAPKAFGFAERDAGTTQLRRQWQARSEMNAWIAQRLESGTPPTVIEMQREAQRIFTQSDVGETFLGFRIGGREFAAERQKLTKEEQGQFTVDLSEIKEDNPAVVRRAESVFRQHGITPSEEQLEQFLGAEAMEDADRQRRILGINAPQSAGVAPGPVPSLQPPPPVIAGASTRFEAALRDDELHHPGKPDLKVFKDSRGVPTIGVGFNLNKPDAKKRIEALGLDYAKVKAGKQSITTAQANKLFREDVAKARSDAGKFLPSFKTLSEKRQGVLTNMAFNLGLSRLNKFKDFKKALEAKDFDKAAKEMLSSDWAKQVGKRARRLAKEMKEG